MGRNTNLYGSDRNSYAESVTSMALTGSTPQKDIWGIGDVRKAMAEGSTPDSTEPAEFKVKIPDTHGSRDSRAVSKGAK